MKTKFSKSPWMVTPQGPADANGMGICSMWGDGEELRANVDLIAAAPDMYKMIDDLTIELKHAIDEVNGSRMMQINSQTETPPDMWDMQSLHEAQLLLKKARGES